MTVRPHRCHGRSGCSSRTAAVSIQFLITHKPKPISGTDRAFGWFGPLRCWINGGQILSLVGIHTTHVTGLMSRYARRAAVAKRQIVTLRAWRAKGTRNTPGRLCQHIALNSVASVTSFIVRGNPRWCRSSCAVVTRHASRPSHAATPPLRRMRQYTPFATISATGLNMSRGQLPDPRAARRTISLIQSPPTQAPSWFRHHRDQAKLAIPITIAAAPRFRASGGFRTARPMPRRVTCDGRHPKTFTIAAVQTSDTVSP